MNTAGVDVGVGVVVCVGVLVGVDVGVFETVGVGEIEQPFGSELVISPEPPVT